MLTAGQAVSPRSQKVGFLHDWVGEGSLQTWASFTWQMKMVAVSGISWEKWNYLTRKYAVVELRMGGDLFLGPNSLPSSPFTPTSFPASLLNLYLCLAPTSCLSL